LALCFAERAGARCRLAPADRGDRAPGRGGIGGCNAVGLRGQHPVPRLLSQARLGAGRRRAHPGGVRGAGASADSTGKARMTTVTALRVHRLPTPLVRPFTTAVRTATSIDVVLVEARSSDGLSGWGEAPASWRVTGESPE